MVCCCPGWCVALAVVAVALYALNAYRKANVDLKKAFAGKRVVLTGASAGIGAETARQLARCGAHLVLAARRADRLEAERAACVVAGAASCVAVECDVTKPDDCTRLIRTAVAAFGGDGGIDVLVLNAGRSSVVRFADTTDNAGYRDVFEVNYWANLNLTRAALPALRTARGNITVVSSLAGKFVTPRRTGYSPTKFALNAFFGCLRLEEPRLTVTVVNPGFVVSEIARHALGATAASAADRDTSQSMPTAECARQLLVACANRDRELVMTAVGKLGVYLATFFPAFADAQAIRISEAQYRKPKDN